MADQDTINYKVMLPDASLMDISSNILPYMKTLADLIEDLVTDDDDLENPIPVSYEYAKKEVLDIIISFCEECYKNEINSKEKASESEELEHWTQNTFEFGPKYLKLDESKMKLLQEAANCSDFLNVEIMTDYLAGIIAKIVEANTLDNIRKALDIEGDNMNENEYVTAINEIEKMMDKGEIPDIEVNEE